MQVKARFYEDDETYDAEILAETKIGFNLVFTEYGNEQVLAGAGVRGCVMEGGMDGIRSVSQSVCLSVYLSIYLSIFI